MDARSGSSSYLNGPNEEESDRLVDEMILTVVAERISGQWMELGRTLGVPDSRLDDIAMNYVSYGAQEMVYQTLNIWREVASTNATVAFLARKLQEIGRMDVSQHILKMAPNPRGGAKNSRFGDTNSRCSDTNTLHSDTNTHYGDTNPHYGDTNARYGDTNTHYGDTNPHNGDTNPHNGDMNPRYGDTNVRCGDTKPIDGVLAEWLERLKNKLHDKYQKFFATALPWVHNIVLSIINYYVDEEIKSQDINEALKRVFSANEQPLRVLVEGPPGYGKPNLLAKLCFDFANYEDYINTFDVVLQYSLHHFNGNLKDIFIEAAELKDSHDKENLLKIVNNKFTRVLLLLDGFDEVPKQHEKAILSLLQGEQFPNVAVVITSRSGQLTFIRRRIKILGVNNGLREGFEKKKFDRIP